MGFESYHPAINFFWFACVITAAILFRQPVFLAIAYISAFAYSVKRNGIKAILFNLCLIPLIIVFACYYSGYTHFGATVLSTNFVGNPMTLESLLYGLTLGSIAATVMMWCSCVFSVFTADKVVYLFGRVSPKLSLFLSIVLRLVPRLKAQGKKISVARRGVGKGFDQGCLTQRILHGVNMISMLVTWLMESMATTSDSMRSRGYGLKGRAAFSIYRFDHRDRLLVIGMFCCLTVVLMGHLLGQTVIRFAPHIIMNPITPMSGVFYIGYALFCILPLMLEVVETLRFCRLRRKCA